MFRSGDNLFRLTTHRDVNHVRLPTSGMNYANPSMIAPVGHPLVYGGINHDGDFLAWAIGSEDAAEADFSSLPRSLPE